MVKKIKLLLDHQEVRKLLPPVELISQQLEEAQVDNRQQQVAVIRKIQRSLEKHLQPDHQADQRQLLLEGKMRNKLPVALLEVNQQQLVVVRINLQLEAQVVLLNQLLQAEKTNRQQEVQVVVLKQQLLVVRTRLLLVLLQGPLLLQPRVVKTSLLRVLHQDHRLLRRQVEVKSPNHSRFIDY